MDEIPKYKFPCGCIYESEDTDGETWSYIMETSMCCIGHKGGLITMKYNAEDAGASEVK